MKKIDAKIIADSIGPVGDRITTFLLTYPRIIHSELMTHRVFSRNAASSRAVPVKKMIESVRNNMFTPLAVQKAHKGMQGSDYFEGVELEQAKQLWIESAELALQQAEKMEKFGITKQLINRILEPYQYYQVLVTATEWENFFELRCPQYHLENVPTVNEDLSLNAKTITIVGKSKKELLKQIDEIDNDSYTGFKNIINKYSDLDWLQINKGQAEIHIQALAEAMWDARNESVPKELKAGQWHIPFGDRMEDEEFLEQVATYEDSYDFVRVKIATTRCARLSYMTFEGEIDYGKDIKLHNHLLENHHMSPFEHCCRAVTEEEYNENFKGKEKGWFRNFKGFKSYRQILEE